MGACSFVFYLLLHFFFFNDTAPPEIYALPLPAALPIFIRPWSMGSANGTGASAKLASSTSVEPSPSRHSTRTAARSEEHTSELQSPDHLVCRLLLEKKNRRST